MTRNLSKIFAVLLIFGFAGCVESLNDAADTLVPSVELYSPKTSDTVSVGKNLINYYASDDQGISYVEVYVNNVFLKRYDPASTNALPVAYLELDSAAYSRKTISYFIKVYDTQNSVKSSVMSNIYVSSKSSGSSDTTSKTAPTAPANFKLSSLSSSSVLLSWTNVAKATSYSLLRKSADQENFVVIKEMAAGTINTLDENLDGNLTYYYKIKAINAYGEAESAIIKRVGTGGLSAPSELSGQALGTTKIQITWRDNSTSELAFIVQRKIASATAYSTLDTLAANTTSFIDQNGLYSSSSFTYRVCALGAYGKSEWSDAVTVTTAGIDLIAPSNLTASYDANTKKVTLVWSDNSIFENQTFVERKTGETGTYAEIGSTITDISTYSDANVVSGNTYYYRVRGYSSTYGVYSSYSNVKSITITQ